MVIWNAILFAINEVSKKLQYPSMCVKSIVQQIESTIHFLINIEMEDLHLV